MVRDRNLQKNLNDWVQLELISEFQAQAIREYYQLSLKERKKNALRFIFAVVLFITALIMGLAYFIW